MTVSPSPQTIRSAPFSRRRLLVVAAAAAVVNVVVYLIGRAAGASMTVTAPEPGEVPAFDVAIGSFVPLVLAGLVTWPIVRRAPAFRPWAAWIGSAFALLSTAEPLVLAGDLGTGATLVAAHLICGAAWFVTLMVGGARR